LSRISASAWLPSPHAGSAANAASGAAQATADAAAGTAQYAMDTANAAAEKAQKVCLSFLSSSPLRLIVSAFMTPPLFHRTAFCSHSAIALIATGCFESFVMIGSPVNQLICVTINCAALHGSHLRFAWSQAYVKSKLTVKDLAQQASDAAAGYTGAARDAAMEVRDRNCADVDCQLSLLSQVSRGEPQFW